MATARVKTSWQTARDQRVLVAVGEEERRADRLDLRAFERHARERHHRADVGNLFRGVVPGLEHRDRAERLPAIVTGSGSTSSNIG